MNEITRVARVAIPKAVLFIPPDGQDRDLDFKNSSDMKAVRRIRAVEYVKARDAQPQDDWVQEPHRLYCPDCFDKGHLSRHKGVKEHDREVAAHVLSGHWNEQSLWGGKQWVHFPSGFEKWPKGPEHHKDCEHYGRSFSLVLEPSGMVQAREEADVGLHTVTLPTTAHVLMPPRPSPFNFRSAMGARMTVPAPAVTTPRLAAVGSIEDFARLLRASFYDPAAMAAKILKTPDGPKSLNDLFLRDVRGVYEFCAQMQGLGITAPVALVSLTPNRIEKFREGWRFPSLGGPALEHDKSRRMVVMFAAQNREVEERLQEIFSRKNKEPGTRVLAYARVGFGADGRPHVLIHRSEQVMAWDEPARQPALL